MGTSNPRTRTDRPQLRTEHPPSGMLDHAKRNGVTIKMPATSPRHHVNPIAENSLQGAIPSAQIAVEPIPALIREIPNASAANLRASTLANSGPRQPFP